MLVFDVYDVVCGLMDEVTRISSKLCDGDKFRSEVKNCTNYCVNKLLNKAINTDKLH